MADMPTEPIPIDPASKAVLRQRLADEIRDLEIALSVLGEVVTPAFLEREHARRRAEITAQLAGLKASRDDLDRQRFNPR